MNEDGIQLLSDVVGTLALISIVIALLVLWRSLRARQAARLKDLKTPQSRLSDVMDEHKRN